MKKLVIKSKKIRSINQLAGSLSHLVPKSMKKIPTDVAIKMARDIAAREIANE